MSVKRIEPFQIDQFFTKDQIDLVYSVIDEKMERGHREKGDKYDEFFKFQGNGFITSNKDWPIELVNIIKNKAEELGQGHVPYENVVLIYARYTHDSGGAPNLTPHVDVVTNKTLYTCTVRLRSLKQWDFYVKDEKFEMGLYGSAVWLTGNQDAHWRPDLEFGQGDYYDILLCQAWSDDDNDLYPEDHKDKMLAQEKEYCEKYKDMLHIGLGMAKPNQTDCVGSSDGQTTDEAYEMAKKPY